MSPTEQQKHIQDMYYNNMTLLSSLIPGKWSLPCRYCKSLAGKITTTGAVKIMIIINMSGIGLSDNAVSILERNCPPHYL